MTGPFRRVAERLGVVLDDAGSLGEVVATHRLTGPASAAVAAAFAAIDDDGEAGEAGVWIARVDRAAADRAAAEVDARVDAGEALPLAGLTFAVKNNIDVQGLRTTAGCRSFGRVADDHAPVVRQLVDAGAVVVGVTNLDQFATGLVGTRSPYGVCPNAHWPGLISGGSSSGSAVAVARGQVDFSIGTDTAGSGRVPAAANGILGWKPTKSTVSTDGVVPACESLDCVSFFARDAKVLGRLREVVNAAPTVPASSGGPSPSGRAPGAVRLGIPAGSQLTFDGDDGWGAATIAAIDRVVDELEAERVVVDIEPYLATGRLLYEGAFVRERFDAVGEFIEEHRADVDPVVYSIIHAAGALAPEDLERDRREVAARERTLRGRWHEIDALVLPTVPRVPTIDEVQAEPIAVNSMLGTYTNFVNLLGLCALTVPVGAARAGGPPASITLIGPPGHDEQLLALARAVGGGDRRASAPLA